MLATINVAITKPTNLPNILLTRSGRHHHPWEVILYEPGEIFNEQEPSADSHKFLVLNSSLDQQSDSRGELANLQERINQ